ncbi:hypothetical protein ACNTMW_20020 [Planosporangium sp. 12N6]|uniref:hypothetical protein n=1 Tax=Planosporangium spinosum TaxID=3402278 RepID=UPI003CEE7981
MGVDARVVMGRRAAGVGELLVVVAVALAGVVSAAVFALGPWLATGGQPPVVRFDPPAVTAPRG